LSQIGESVSIDIDTSKPKIECVFCGKKHQDEAAAEPYKFKKSMKTLKENGRKISQTIFSRLIAYPQQNIPPLVEWSSNSNLTSIGGYKAAAHHCIAFSKIDNHKISGELHKAGYDPNGGYNCIWLPYSRKQFIRARAYGKGLQKHRGGHTKQYFITVEKHIDRISDNVKKKFCFSDKKVSKALLIKYISLQEQSLWRGVASAKIPAYQLYNNSFLDPNVDWGTYNEEKDITKDEYLGIEIPFSDDDAAEQESKEDPETVVDE
jgi:hypothetical protein